MTLINSILSQGLIKAFGWTLIHSVWQGALIALIFALLLVVMRKFTSQSRYYVATLALLVVLVVSVVTFFKV